MFVTGQENLSLNAPFLFQIIELCSLLHTSMWKHQVYNLALGSCILKRRKEKSVCFLLITVVWGIICQNTAVSHKLHRHGRGRGRDRGLPYQQRPASCRGLFPAARRHCWGLNITVVILTPVRGQGLQDSSKTPGVSQLSDSHIVGGHWEVWWVTGWHGALLCLFLRVVGTFSQVLPSSPHPLPSSAGLSPVLVGVLNLIEAERPPVINGVIIQFPSHLLFFPVITHASHSFVFSFT